MDTPENRLARHIFNLFNDYLKKRPPKDDQEQHALIELRNLLVQFPENLLNEPVNPQSSWIPSPGGESETRPAGITNEEFQEFDNRLSKLFIGQGLYTSGLFMDVLNLFREAFLRPAENRPFQGGTYARLIFGLVANAETVKKQAIPCEICQENRVTDVCHIVPRRLNGNQMIDNTLFLCPTHHRLFDSCMLTKEEWDKIDWGRKSTKSQTYAFKVLMVAHAKFWEKINAGGYKKQTTWEIGLYGLYKDNEKEIAE